MIDVPEEEPNITVESNKIQQERSVVYTFNKREGDLGLPSPRDGTRA